MAGSFTRESPEWMMGSDIKITSSIGQFDKLYSSQTYCDHSPQNR